MSFTRRYKKAMVLAMVAGLFMMSGSLTASATHTRCDGPEDIKNTTGLPGGGSVFVGVDPQGGSSPSGAGGFYGVCASYTNAGGTTTYRSVLVGIGDPNTSSTGATGGIILCSDPDCASSTTPLGATGAEAGQASDCNGAAPGTGTCRVGTTVYVNNIPIQIDNQTGVDDSKIHLLPDIKFGNQPSQIIACAGMNCLYSFAITFGSLDVYVGNPQGQPLITQPLCVRVGPNAPDCTWVSSL